MMKNVAKLISSTGIVAKPSPGARHPEASPIGWDFRYQGSTFLKVPQKPLAAGD